MRLKSVILASTSMFMLAGAAPAFAQTDNLPQDPVAVQDEVTTEDAIVVTGLRRSLETSQKIKRESEGIVDAIVAEDIGKLPDTFASSALQRVPGVNVTRGGGESAGVTVRGLPDLTTTYNGRDIFTAEGRYVQIQDFPAGTVAALEVYKSGTASQIEGGIAGAVNVRGRKPFDFTGFELSGSLNYVHSEQAQREAPNGNLLISDRWNTGIGEMGLLVNASYVGIEFLDSTREQSLVIGTTDAATRRAMPASASPTRRATSSAMASAGARRSMPRSSGSRPPSSKSMPTACSRVSARRITIAGCSFRSSAA